MEKGGNGEKEVLRPHMGLRCNDKEKVKTNKQLNVFFTFVFSSK